MRFALLTAALSPVLIPQGLWARWRTLRMPEPPGARTGLAGDGPRLRLLIAGDSAAAGVGASHQDRALCGQLVGSLSQSHEVCWQLQAVTGATTASTLQQLAGSAPTTFDVAVLSLGVNDVTRGIPLERWRQQQLALWSLLRSRFGVKLIVACGLPPLHGFPALPQPLRWHLGARATQFHDLMQELAQQQQHTHFFDLRFTRDVTLMAADGFHPGPEVYRRWGLGVAEVVRNTL